MEFFLRKIDVKPIIHQNLAVSKALSILNPENYCIPRRHSLLVQTTTQPLGNFEPQKPRRYKQL